MDIIISGIEDIKAGQMLQVAENQYGELFVRETVRGEWHRVEVLPEGHGRLIDAERLIKTGIRYSCGIDEGGLVYVPLGEVMKSIREAETVVLPESKK